MASIKVKDGNTWRTITGFKDNKQPVALRIDGSYLVLDLADGTSLRVDLGGLSPTPTPIEEMQYVTKNGETFITKNDENFIVREEI